MRRIFQLFSTCFSRLPRLRLLTVAVLFAAALALALANLWSEPLTADRLIKFPSSQKPIERPYGWPFTWRSHTAPPHRIAFGDEYTRPLTWFWITSGGRWLDGR